jgi:hypothetical protein
MKLIAFVFILALMGMINVFHQSEEIMAIIQRKNPDHDATAVYVGGDIDAATATVVAVKQDMPYKAAVTERYIMDNSVSLGYDKADKSASGCKIWHDPDASDTTVHQQFNAYRKDLNEKFTPATKAFAPISNLMHSIRSGTGDTTGICKTARLHPDGLKALFPNSELSHGNSGFLEPLTTPMRHPNYCWNGRSLFDLNYLVHDFEAMCLKLKQTSRIVLIDMGAGKYTACTHTTALNVDHCHPSQWQSCTNSIMLFTISPPLTSRILIDTSNTDLARENGPVIQLLDLYEKFGFVFDHIYGFELKFVDPNKVYRDQLPAKYMSSFHWINAGTCVYVVDK